MTGTQAAADCKVESSRDKGSNGRPGHTGDGQLEFFIYYEYR